jgi:hypothetical protein
MTSGRNTARKAGWTVLAMLVAIAAFGGCAADPSKRIASDRYLRERVMGAIAADGGMAVEMARRLVASDSLRARVIETMLAEEHAAQYVIARIGRNTDAVDYVMQVAASDSTGRQHLLTLLKGMQMAMQAKKK